MPSNRYVVKKPIALIQAECENGGLKRSLTAANLVSLGVGAIIGAGIFVMTGQAAATHAGPAIILSFVFAGIACGLAALCYAELASVLPVSGSAYTYAYASLGEVFAWAMGWLLVLEYGVASATVAVGWSGYIVSFLKSIGIVIPAVLTVPYGEMVTLADGTQAAGLFNLPAFLGMLTVTGLLILGVKESANVNNVIVFIKAFVILLFIGIGAFYVNPENWHPFLPENTGVDGEFGMSGVLKAAGIIFFAYIGFEAVSTAAQEARNPQRDVPIGILGSLAVCTVLYIMVALVLTGIVPYSMLNVPDPIAVGVDAIGLPWLAFLVKIGAIAGLSSVMLVLVYGQTRIFYAMSRDGLIPSLFSRIHPKYQTPHLNTLVVGAIVAVVAGTVPLRTLGDLVSIGTLFAFIIICFSVIYLRVKEKDLPRPFKVPFYPLTPILGMLACGYLMWGLRATFPKLTIYFAIGVAIYFLYGQFNSRMRLLPQKAE